MTTLTRINRRSANLMGAEQRRYARDLIRYIAEQNASHVRALEASQQALNKARFSPSNTYSRTDIQRIAFISTRHLLAETPESIADEFDLLIDLRMQQKDSGVPQSNYIEHWVLSWLPGEQPTPNQLEKCIEIFARQMNFADHQLLCIAHNDTEAFHLHIAANRIHPETLQLVPIRKNFDCAQKVTAQLDHRFGWTPAPHARYGINDKGKLQRRLSKDAEAVPLLPKGAALSERIHGVKSIATLAAEIAGPIIKSAKNWDQLHQQLATEGFCYELKGAGAVLSYWCSADDDLVPRPKPQLVKASAAGSFAARKKLEARLGAYVAPQPDLVRRVTRAPEALNEIQLIPDIEQAFGKFQHDYDEERKFKRLIEEDRKERQLEREKIKREQAAELKRIRQIADDNSLEAWRVQLAREYVDQTAKERLRRHRPPVPAGQINGLKSFRKYLQSRHPEHYPLYRQARGYQPHQDHWLVPAALNASSIQTVSILNVAGFRGVYDPQREVVDYYAAELDLSAKVPRPAFTDRGQVVAVLDSSAASVKAALELAHAKFGQVHVISKNETFLRQVIEVAAQHDFNFIANATLREQIEQRRQELIAYEQQRQRALEQQRQFNELRDNAAQILKRVRATLGSLSSAADRRPSQSAHGATPTTAQANPGYATAERERRLELESGDDATPIPRPMVRPKRSVATDSASVESNRANGRSAAEQSRTDQQLAASSADPKGYDSQSVRSNDKFARSDTGGEGAGESFAQSVYSVKSAIERFERRTAYLAEQNQPRINQASRNERPNQQNLHGLEQDKRYDYQQTDRRFDRDDGPEGGIIRSDDYTTYVSRRHTGLVDKAAAIDRTIGNLVHFWGKHKADHDNQPAVNSTGISASESQRVRGTTQGVQRLYDTVWVGILNQQIQQDSQTVTRLSLEIKQAQQLSEMQPLADQAAFISSRLESLQRYVQDSQSGLIKPLEVEPEHETIDEAGLAQALEEARHVKALYREAQAQHSLSICHHSSNSATARDLEQLASEPIQYEHGLDFEVVPLSDKYISQHLARSRVNLPDDVKALLETWHESTTEFLTELVEIEQDYKQRYELRLEQIEDRVVTQEADWLEEKLPQCRGLYRLTRAAKELVLETIEASTGKVWQDMLLKAPEAELEAWIKQVKKKVIEFITAIPEIDNDDDYTLTLDRKQMREAVMTPIPDHVPSPQPDQSKQAQDDLEERYPTPTPFDNYWR